MEVYFAFYGVLLWSISKAVLATERFRESSNGLPGTTYKQWTWSDWFDTDSGQAETETYDAIVKRGWPICSKEGKLVGSECQMVESGTVISDGYSFNTSSILGENLQCKVTGITCRNINCMNFKVRFLCEDKVIECGSPIFYLVVLVVPMALIFFRIYFWDRIKKRFKKRFHNHLTVSNTAQDSIDMSVYDPPSYDDLFGSQYTHPASGHSQEQFDNEVHQSSADVNSSSSQNEIPRVSRTYNFSGSYTRGATSSGSMTGNTASDGAVFYIATGNSVDTGSPNNDICQTPPPTYSEALVILKRNKGLDASHL